MTKRRLTHTFLLNRSRRLKTSVGRNPITLYKRSMSPLTWMRNYISRTQLRRLAPVKDEYDGRDVCIPIIEAKSTTADPKAAINTLVAELAHEGSGVAIVLDAGTANTSRFCQRRSAAASEKLLAVTYNPGTALKFAKQMPDITVTCDDLCRVVQTTAKTAKVGFVFADFCGGVASIMPTIRACLDAKSPRILVTFSYRQGPIKSTFKNTELQFIKTIEALGGRLVPLLPELDRVGVSSTPFTVLGNGMLRYRRPKSNPDGNVGQFMAQALIEPRA